MLGDILRAQLEREDGERLLGLELVDAAGSQQAFTPMMRPNLVASQASQTNVRPSGCLCWWSMYFARKERVVLVPDRNLARAFASPMTFRDMLLLSLSIPRRLRHLCPSYPICLSPKDSPVGLLVSELNPLPLPLRVSQSYLFFFGDFVISLRIRTLPFLATSPLPSIS